MLEYDLNEDTESEINTTLDRDDGNYHGAFEYDDIETDTSGDLDTVGGNDTSTEVTVDAENEQDAETDNANCPIGLELKTDRVFTELIDGKSAERHDYHDVCDDGEVIVGYHGFYRTGNNNNLIHGKIQALCSRLSIHVEGGKCRTKTGDPTHLPLRGNSGAIEWARMCPDDEVIVGYQGKTGSDIDQITFTCAPLLISTANGGHTIVWGKRSYLQRAGGNGGNYEYEDECPAAQIPTSSIMYASEIDVNALGLGCQRVDFVR